MQFELFLKESGLVWSHARQVTTDSPFKTGNKMLAEGAFTHFRIAESELPKMAVGERLKLGTTGWRNSAGGISSGDDVVIVRVS